MVLFPTSPSADRFNLRVPGHALGASLQDARMMVAAADEAGVANMVGFNYIRTPACQLAREIIEGGEIGEIVHVRAEHTEDFLADPEEPGSWRTRDRSSGTLGDLAPHIVNAVLRLVGPVERLVADVMTAHVSRPGASGSEAVTNDDQVNLLCRFRSGAMGNIHVSRVATGRKMGYGFDIAGTKGGLRFDAEDQNAPAIRCPCAAGSARLHQDFDRPQHPDFRAFSKAQATAPATAHKSSSSNVIF